MLQIVTFQIQLPVNTLRDHLYTGTIYGLYLVPLNHQGSQAMKLSESVKPISYLKSHTAKVLREVSEGQRTMVITQHGEARAVLQDITSYEQTQESLALLKMLAQSSKSIQEGRSKPLKKAFADVRKHVRKDTE